MSKSESKSSKWENFSKYLSHEQIELFQREEKLQAEINDVAKLVAILANDLKYVAEIIQESSLNPILFRTYCRSAFAMIEGTLSGFARISYHADRTSFVVKDMHPFEMHTLLEKRIEIGRNGKMKLKNNHYLPLQTRINFVVRTIVSQWDLSYEMPKGGGSGWEEFVKSIDLRNDLVHPKTVQHLSVDDGQYEMFIKGLSWFGDVRSNILALVQKRVELVRAMQAEREKEKKLHLEFQLKRLKRFGNLEKVIKIAQENSKNPQHDLLFETALEDIKTEVLYISDRDLFL